MAAAHAQPPADSGGRPGRTDETPSAHRRLDDPSSVTVPGGPPATESAWRATSCTATASASAPRPRPERDTSCRRSRAAEPSNRRPGLRPRGNRSARAVILAATSAAWTRSHPACRATSHRPMSPRRASRSPGRRRPTTWGRRLRGAERRRAGGSTASTLFALTALRCGAMYTIGVRALDAAGHRSDAASILVTTGGCPDTAAPSPPSALRVTSVNQTPSASAGLRPPTTEASPDTAFIAAARRSVRPGRPPTRLAAFRAAPAMRSPSMRTTRQETAPAGRRSQRRPPSARRPRPPRPGTHRRPAFRPGSP